jgi:polysaccharide export outer membrane protein
MEARIAVIGLIGLTLFSACGLRTRKSLDPVPNVVAQNQETIEAIAADKRLGALSDSMQAESEPVYRIEPDDQLTVFFPGAPKQQFDALVRPDGRITIPVSGDLMVSGRSPEQVSKDITQIYSTFLRKPKAVVSVRSVAPQSFYVFGEVGQPDKYTYSGPMDLMGALSSAGGVARTASLNNVVVLRVDPSGVYNYQVFSLNDLLSNSNPAPVWIQPRDIIIVPTSSIADVGIWLDQYVKTFLPPIDSFLRGRYYWKLGSDVIR